MAKIGVIAGGLVSLQMVARGDLAGGAGCLAGAVAGWAITPDIDHVAVTYEEFRIYRFSRYLGFLWQWIWTGYSILIPHRGISHVPVVGTLTRILYLVVVGRVLLYLGTGIFWDLGMLPPAPSAGPPVAPWGELAAIGEKYPDFVWPMLGAWCAQDLIHIATDLIWSAARGRPVGFGSMFSLALGCIAIVLMFSV